MKCSELITLLKAQPSDAEVYVTEDICGGWVKLTEVEYVPDRAWICLYNDEQVAIVTLDDDESE